MKNKIILFLVLCFCINFAGIAQSTVHESVKFQSKKLGKEVSYSIYLPDGYATSNRYYPVLYLLHGYTDNETMWIQTGQMQESRHQQRPGCSHDRRHAGCLGYLVYQSI